MNNSLKINEIIKNNSAQLVSNVCTLSHSEFIQELTNAIEHLIEVDFKKLMHLLYRMDINEYKLKRIFELNDNVANKIALLIIEREKKKIISRAKYL